MKQLSILIASIEKRYLLLRSLLDKLYSQTADEVEIITDIDNCEVTVGTKRNRLLKYATGKYTVFADDDDAISPDYISKILKAIQSGPDVVGIEGIITTAGGDPRKFVHSLKYKEWSEDPVNKIYFRNPNHLNPVKRSIALKVGFPELNFKEDKAFSMGILPLLKTEVYIPGPIYFYQFDEAKSETNKYNVK